MERINVVVVEDAEIYSTEIENTMEMFEAIVAGDISIARLHDDYIMICNREPEYEKNCMVFDNDIYGTFIVSKMKKEHKQLESLNETETAFLIKIFEKGMVEEIDFAFELIEA